MPTCLRSQSLGPVEAETVLQFQAEQVIFDRGDLGRGVIDIFPVIGHIRHVSVAFGESFDLSESVAEVK